MIIITIRFWNSLFLFYLNRTFFLFIDASLNIPFFIFYFFSSTISQYIFATTTFSCITATSMSRLPLITDFRTVTYSSQLLFSFSALLFSLSLSLFLLSTFYLFLFFSLSLSLPLFLSLSHTLSHSLSLSLRLALSIAPIDCLSFCISNYFSLSFPNCLCHALFFSDVEADNGDDEES